MKELFPIQNKMLDVVNNLYVWSAFDKIDWNQRLIGIKGLRGVGKTTLMLQYMKYHFENTDKALYVTADSPWFYNHSLYETIVEWDNNGGKLMVIDEIHKYPLWARELKVAFDTHSKMKFIFSASSAFDIFKAEGDLSRRAAIFTLHGMSFREYLNFVHNLDIPSVSLQEILENGPEISRQMNGLFKPVPNFKDYLNKGYFPFTAKGDDLLYREKLTALINTVLENDLASVQDYSPANIRKIKQMLSVIAKSAPFTPNISKLAERLGVGRVTVYNFLKHLEDAKILKTARKRGKGISELQKPDKVYIENTNLALALTENAGIGNLRETFFYNQISNAGHEIHLAKKGDFLIENTYTVEVGGKNKDASQLKDVPKSYLALDDTEYAFPGTVPLWMFGLMY